MATHNSTEDRQLELEAPCPKVLRSLRNRSQRFCVIAGTLLAAGLSRVAAASPPAQGAVTQVLSSDSLEDFALNS